MDSQEAGLRLKYVIHRALQIEGRPQSLSQNCWRFRPTTDKRNPAEAGPYDCGKKLLKPFQSDSAAGGLVLYGSNLALLPAGLAASRLRLVFEREEIIDLSGIGNRGRPAYAIVA